MATASNEPGTARPHAMKHDISHLPAHKQQELRSIVDLIRAKAEVEMIILFGSYATGNWVEDRYVEDGVLYEYKSDFDLMVVLDCKHESARGNKWHALETKVLNNEAIKTPVGFIVEDIRRVNEHLERKQYFYVTMREQGVLLYDSGRHRLAEARKLDSREQADIAQEHFDQWYGMGLSSLKFVRFGLEQDELNDSAFLLHQATERFLFAAILVFTDFKPKTHDIEALHKQVRGLDGRFVRIFPQATPKERQAFKRLKRAYIDARFKKDYEITREELDWLLDQVESLKALTETACREKIGQIRQE